MDVVIFNRGGYWCVRSCQDGYTIAVCFPWSETVALVRRLGLNVLGVERRRDSRSRLYPLTLIGG